MTDRINAMIVVLEEDIRSDDVESLVNAIRHLRGVANVKPHVASYEDVIARERVRSEIGGKLFDAIREIVFDEKPRSEKRKT